MSEPSSAISPGDDFKRRGAARHLPAEFGERGTVDFGLHVRGRGRCGTVGDPRAAAIAVTPIAITVLMWCSSIDAARLPQNVWCQPDIAGATAPIAAPAEDKLAYLADQPLPLQVFMHALLHPRVDARQHHRLVLAVSSRNSHVLLRVLALHRAGLPRRAGDDLGPLRTGFRRRGHCSEPCCVRRRQNHHCYHCRRRTAPSGASL